MNEFEYQKFAKEAAKRANNPEVIVLKSMWKDRDSGATLLSCMQIFLFGCWGVSNSFYQIPILIILITPLLFYSVYERNKIGNVIQRYEE